MNSHIIGHLHQDLHNCFVSLDMLGKMLFPILCTCIMIITRVEFAFARDMNTTISVVNPLQYDSIYEYDIYGSEFSYSYDYRKSSGKEFDFYDQHSSSVVNLMIVDPSVTIHEMITVSFVNATFEPYDYAFLIRTYSESQCKKVIRINDTNCEFNLKNFEWYARLYIRSSSTEELTADNINIEIMNNNISSTDIVQEECKDWSMQGECHGNRMYHTYMVCRSVYGEPIPFGAPEYVPQIIEFSCLLGCSTNCSCYLQDGVLVTSCGNDTEHTTAVVWKAPDLHGNLAILLQGNLDHIGGDAFSSYHFRGEVTYLQISSDQTVRVIEKNAFNGFGNLSSLILSYNGIKQLKNGSFNFLTKLKSLELNWNEIDKVEVEAFASLNNLEALYLKQNQITTLPFGLFSCLYFLQRLILTNNQIQDIAPGLFFGLIGLDTLDLSYNHIHSLKPKSFGGLYKLQILYLNGNKLTHLSPGVFLRQAAFIESGGGGSSPCINTNNSGIAQQGKAVCCRSTEEGVPPSSQNKPPPSTSISSLQLVKLNENNITEFTFDSFQGLKNVTVEVDHEWLCCFLKNSNCIVPTRVREKNNFLTCNRLLPNTVAKILLWIFGCLAVIGNITVIVWKLRLKANKKVQPLLIANLAISDLLMGMYMLIIASADVYYGAYFPAETETWRQSNTCLVASTLSMVSSETSILLVTLISLDRLMGIRFTFSKFRLHFKGAFIAVVLMWGLSLTLGLLPVFANLPTWNYELSEVCMALPLSMKIAYKVSSVYSVMPGQYFYSYSTYESKMYYSIAVFIGLNSLCCLLIAICYIWIFVTVKLTTLHAGRQRDKQEEIRMAMKMAVIVLTDFCCWVPVIIMGIMVQTGIKEIPPVANAWIVTLLMPINSAINPFLYTLATVISERYHKTRTKWRRRNDIAQKQTVESSL